MGSGSTTGMSGFLHREFETFLVIGTFIWLYIAVHPLMLTNVVNVLITIVAVFALYWFCVVDC